MKKGILCSITVLALVLGLALTVVTPVMASEIGLAKNIKPLTPTIYYIGDTIQYVLTVTNPGLYNLTNYIDLVEDTLPNGSTVTLATNITHAPGDSDTYSLNYTVAEADLQLIGGRWKVVNTLHVTGTDSNGDPIDATTSKSSLVLRPELSIEKTVDFNNDGVFTDSETYYAGEPADWAINVTNTGYDPVYNIYVSDDNKGVNFYGPFNLNPGESEIVPVYTTYPTVHTLNTACAQGVDEIGGVVGPVCDPAEVFVNKPNTLTTIAANATTVPLNGKVTLNVTEQNTGGEPLTNPYVLVNPGGYNLTKLSAYFVPGSDTGNDGILGVGENWRWANIPSGAITTPTTFVALGFGTDSQGQEVSYAAGYPGERALVTVNTPPPPVGWETYPINKLRVLLPWIALLAAVMVGAGLLVLRRRRT